MGTFACLARGVRLRCPGCGRGRLYESLFEVRERCAHCSLEFQKDPGDWTGGAEITMILASALSIGLFLILTARVDWSLTARLVVVLGAFVAGTPFLYRHVKGLWIGIVRAWDGPDPQPNPIKDPPEFARLWEEP